MGWLSFFLFLVEGFPSRIDRTHVARGSGGSSPPQGETELLRVRARMPCASRCTCHRWVPHLFTSRGDSGDTGDLGGVIGPRLEILEGEERGVVDTDGVSLDGLVDGFLEGFLLQLHEDAVCLLPLSLPFLRCLPPRREGAIRGAWGSKGRDSPERLSCSGCS